MKSPIRDKKFLLTWAKYASWIAMGGVLVWFIFSLIAAVFAAGLWGFLIVIALFFLLVSFVLTWNEYH